MTTQARPIARIARLFDRSLSLRFIVVGVANTAFSTLLFMLLLYLGFGVALGSALALAAGVLVSYATQGSIVFRHRSLGAFVRFVLAWTIIYLVNLAEIKALIHLGCNRYVAGLISTIPTTIISFFVQKLLVFQVRTA